MMERIREGLWYVKTLFSGALPGEKKAVEKRPIPTQLRGNMRSVIVVKPDDPMFEQAVFILNDSYMRRRDEPAQELMRQAREAAERCTGNYLPHRRSRGGRIFRALAVFVFAAALVIICLYLR